MTILRPPSFCISASRFRGLLPSLLAVAAALGTSACSPVVRERTLPPSIKSVYVPMAINRTAEPGLEEGVTVALQREILADGRLDLVRENEADAIIRVTLTQFDRAGRSFDADDFPTSQVFDTEASLRIEENIPGRPAIGGNRQVLARAFFNADTRTYTFDPEPQAKEQLYEALAREFVLEILTGDFTDVTLSTASREKEPTRIDVPIVP